MSEPKPLASLSPSLLARKGGARPAMRPQLQPLSPFQEERAAPIDDDLGWNDMGHDHDPKPALSPVTAPLVAAQDRIAPTQQPALQTAKPDVIRQQEAVVRRMGVPVESGPRPRRSALSDGRRAAFTLRVDADRHLKLRLACTLRNRSAQQLVTEALDQLLNDLPDLSALAAQVARQRK